MAINLTNLKTELDDDSKTLGYSGQTDQWVADKLNEIGASEETVVRETVETADIITAIFSDVTEFNALTDSEIGRLNLLSPIGTVDPAVLQDIFLDMFPAGGEGKPIIRGALIALATRSASRAEALFGERVSIKDVHLARLL